MGENHFDVNYLFCAVYDNDLFEERIDKYTLLYLDTRNNLENLVGALLKVEGININALNMLSLWTILHHAAVYNSEKVIGVY